MPRTSFLDIVTYLEDLATKHADITESYRWNVLDASGAMRSGINTPLMLIDAIETQTTGGPGKTIHKNTTAITILGKPNTPTAHADAYQSQNEVLDHCQKICFEIEARIIHDSKQTVDASGNKNWMYGLVDRSSFHFFKVGPIFSDRLFGYRCELTLKNTVPDCPDKTKWSDL